MEGVVFNREKIKARDKIELYKQLPKDASASDQLEFWGRRYAYLAEFFSRVVETCPPEWGDAKDPNTYLELEDRVFGELWSAFNAAETKN